MRSAPTQILIMSINVVECLDRRTLGHKKIEVYARSLEADETLMNSS